jgi:hypothetical protein
VGERQDVDGGIGEMEGVYIVLTIVVYLYVCSRQPNASQRCHWLDSSIAYFTCMSWISHGNLLASLKNYDVGIVE